MNITFKFSVFLTALLTISYIVLCILSFARKTASPWKFVEAIFRLIQGITQITILVIVAHEKRFQAVTHPMTIRLYWVASFFISVLFAISAIIRISSIHMNEDQDRDLKIDDVFSLVFLPISAIFLVFSIKGSTGIAVTEADELESNLEEPLLQDKANVTAYAFAIVFSRAVWPIALRSSLPCTRRASDCWARPDCDLKGMSDEEKEEELESESGGELESFGLKLVFSSLEWWSSKGLRGAVRESTKISLPSNRGKSAFTVSWKYF